MTTSLTLSRQAMPHTRRFGRYVVVGIVLATFGPYLTGSIRTEQIAVYALVVLIAPVFLRRFFQNADASFLVPWSLYILAATLGVLFPSEITGRWVSGNVLAGYDGMLVPLAIMLIVWSVVPKLDAPLLLATVSRLVAVAMALNGLLAIVNIRVDLSLYLRPFWSTTSSDVLSVAERAAQLGRYGGIFNQPAEAGALYGVAGLAAIYSWRRRPALLALLMGLITVGGLLSVSKVFILGGLPLILFYWLKTQKKGRKVGLVVGVVVLAFGILQSGLFAAWSGTQYLARLLDPQGGFLSFYTSGRTGADSGVSQVVTEVLHTSPLVGMGAGGWLIAYDSAIAESMAMGGILGLGLYVAVLVAVLGLSRRFDDGDLRLFSLLFGILLIGSAIGFSPLTANRVSTIVWIFVALFVLCRQQRPSGAPDSDLIDHSLRPLAAAAY